MEYRITQTISAEDEALVIKGSYGDYMSGDPIIHKYWQGLFTHFPSYQFGVQSGESMLAIGNSIPLFWQGEWSHLPEEGWDWAVEKGFQDLSEDKIPNVLCGLQIAVAREQQGKGLASVALKEMLSLARNKGYSHVIIPVRPSMKHMYPLTPMDHYMQWHRDDGLPYDPWLRVHVRAGAEMLTACNRAMTIPGSIAQWENWTGLRFFESNHYVIPGALASVYMDLEKDRGIYVEPNVWVLYSLERNHS